MLSVFEVFVPWCLSVSVSMCLHLFIVLKLL